MVLFGSGLNLLFGMIVRRDDHFRALRHLYRFSEIVAELPIAIIVRNVQHHPFLPVGKDQLVSHIFAAHVHMRRRWWRDHHVVLESMAKTLVRVYPIGTLQLGRPKAVDSGWLSLCQL